jgi:sigma-B regulation protein RsbU (phosphoserine phosphatase)
VIDFDKMDLTFASAGHNPPWLFKRDGDSYTLQSLVAVGQRLGEVEDAPPFAESSLPITPGDILFMYTDGLTEGKNTEGEMYGKKRVRKAVQAALAQGPKAVIESLMTEFQAHNGSKPLDDDVTLAVAKIGGL